MKHVKAITKHTTSGPSVAQIGPEIGDNDLYVAKLGTLAILTAAFGLLIVLPIIKGPQQ